MFASLSVLTMTIPLSATTLFSDLGTGSDVFSRTGSVLVTDNIWHGDSFTVAGAGDFLLDQIDLGVEKNGSGTSFEASIWTDASGALGSKLGSWDLTASATSCCGLATQSGISGVTLTGGTSYWIVLSGRSGGNIFWDAAGDGSTGDALVSSDSGAGWSLRRNETRLAFDVMGTAAETSAPEPGSLILAGMGIAGLLAFAGLRRRHEQQC